MRIEDQFARPSEVFAVDSQVNATATATVAAAANKRFMVTGATISANGNVAAAVSVTLTNGATTIDCFEIPATAIAPIVVNYVRPMQCDVNVAAAISCPALGAAIRGSVAIRGYFTTV